MQCLNQNFCRQFDQKSIDQKTACTTYFKFHDDDDNDEEMVTLKEELFHFCMTFKLVIKNVQNIIVPFLLLLLFIVRICSSPPPRDFKFNVMRAFLICSQLSTFKF